jgi:hypothetical protein
MPFAPVTTLDDLDGLDDAEVREGYLSAQRGDPEPGPNRGRAFWHGWRCRMMDHGELEIPPDHHKLVSDWVARNRKNRDGG